MSDSPAFPVPSTGDTAILMENPEPLPGPPTDDESGGPSSPASRASVSVPAEFPEYKVDATPLVARPLVESLASAVPVTPVPESPLSSRPSSHGENLYAPGSPMEEVFRIATVLARRESPVLLHGESGTGKEVLAHWLHTHSHR